MRQNCLPHLVYRAISTRMARVHTAAIAQPRAIHTSEVHSSLPQSSVGVNISASTPARYLGVLAATSQGSHGDGLVTLHAALPPLAVAEQLQVSLVVLFDGGPMADADDDGVRQFRAQQLIQRELQHLVKGRGCLIHEHRLRLLQQNTRK